MTIAISPVVVRAHARSKRKDTEAARRLLADDAEQLAKQLESLDEEANHELAGSGEEVSAEGESVQEMTRYDIDDLDPDRVEPEVDDTPSDDAVIAAARIERFEHAHGGPAPVDAGPFVTVPSEKDSGR